MSEPITEQWIREVGFKWHEVERSPNKHWVLKLGAALPKDRMFAAPDDLMIELAPLNAELGLWFCWLRADYCGRYTRLLHIRHMQSGDEITTLISALIGYAFDPLNVLYGVLHRPEDAARLKKDADSLHHRLARDWGKRAERQSGREDDPSHEGLVTP